MKKFFIQSARAFGFFAIYLGSQIATMMVASIVCGIIVVYRHRGEALTGPEMTSLEAQQLYMSVLAPLVVASAVLALIIYLIIFAARKVNPLEQTDIRKLSLKAAGLSVLGGVSSMLFFNYFLNLIPFPEDILQNLVQEMGLVTDAPLWLAITGEAILVPIMEEVVFRGLLYGRLRRGMPAIVAAIISSLVFGLMHGHPIWALWAFAAGMVFCYARMKTDSILPGIIMHIMMNSFGVLSENVTFLNYAPVPLIILLTVLGFLGLLAFFEGFMILGKKENAKEREAGRFALEEKKQLEKQEAKKASEKESSVFL